MKKVLFIVLLSNLLISCSIGTPLAERKIDTVFYDYRPFAKQGFLITPNPYTQSFTPIGEIFIKIIPADIPVKGEVKYDIVTNGYVTNITTTKEEIYAEDLLNIIVEEAKKQGADALANFTVNKVSESYYNPTYKRVITYFAYYQLSGFAIKRLQ